MLREEEAGALREMVARHAPAAEVWVARREMMLPAERPARMVAFLRDCPAGGLLRHAARGRGVPWWARWRFGIIMRNGPEDYLRLVEAVLHVGADGLVTTAKDAVKIPAVAIERLSGVARVVVAELKVGLLEEEVALRRLRRVVGLAEPG